MTSDKLIQKIVLDNALRARRRWNWNDTIYPEHLLAVLVEEVGELSAAIMNKHEHRPSYELIQIGGIIQNWLHQMEADDVEDSAAQEKEKHP